MPATIDSVLTELQLMRDQQNKTFQEVESLRGIDPRGWGTPKQVLRRQYKEVKDQTWGMDSLGQIGVGVFKAATGGVNPRNVDELKPYFKALPSGLAETVGSQGGVLLPPAFAAELLMRTYENDLLSRTRMLPMSGETIKINAIDEASRADGSRFGGVRAYWTKEATAMTPSKPSFNQITLHPEKLTVFMRATDEIMADLPALEAWLNLVASEELSFKIGDALIRGDGDEKPLGVLNSPATVTVASTSPADTVQAEDIANLYAQIWGKCQPNVIWLYNQELFTSLVTMTVGMGASNYPVYLPPGGLSASPYGTIFGRPAMPSEFCSAKGDVGDIICLDPTQILSAVRGGVQTGVSIHLYFDTNETAFRWIIRIDAEPWWLTSLTPYKGTLGLSFCTVLAAR